jgi:hypothetical protein
MRANSVDFQGVSGGGLVLPLPNERQNAPASAVTTHRFARPAHPSVGM